MNILFLILFSILLAPSTKASPPVDSFYDRTYQELENMLSGKCPPVFKRAVFITENAYMKDSLDYNKFSEYVGKLAVLAEVWMKFNPLKSYHYADSLEVQKNLAIFKVLKDSIKIIMPSKEEFIHLPYTYDFSDFEGQADWRKMFVTKLLAYHSGNCHNLPYLYKIIANELGAPCWIALAPNHSYIENRCKKIGWYNTELTSGDFPIDAWIMGSGYIPVEAIQNGIYMDTLSNQQSIAMCVLDLAKGYEHQTKNYYDGFIIKCCDLSLQYFPKNVQAMLLKAETLKRIYERQSKRKDLAARATYQEMEALYVNLFHLGYREMPVKMYMDWLQSVIKQRDKYANKALKEVTQ